MPDTILVLNSGSSSIKFGLFDISAAEPTLLCKGLLDEHEARPRLVVKGTAGEDLFETRSDAPDAAGGHLFADVLGFIEDRFGERSLRAVGHRIVHGGPDYSGPVALTDDITAKLEALTPLAPLHQPRCLAPVRTFAAIRPELTQIACFDTAFHHGPRRRRAASPFPGASRRVVSGATASTASRSNMSRDAWPRSRRSLQPGAQSSRISATAPASAHCTMAAASTRPWG